MNVFVFIDDAYIHQLYLQLFIYLNSFFNACETLP